MTTAPEILQERLRRQLERRELNRLLGDGGLTGRSGLVAPRMPARKAGGVRELPIAMPEPLTVAGKPIGAGRLLVMSVTGDSIASGGDYVTFSTILARHQFGSAPPGASFTHPIDGIYVLIYEHAWNSYEGGGAVTLEIDGVLIPEGEILNGSTGQTGAGWIVYAATAGQVGKIKVTQTSGSAQTCNATVRIGVTDPTGAGAVSSAGTAVSSGTQDAPDVGSWVSNPPGWLDGDAHWIWHVYSGGGRPAESSWLVGTYTSPAARAVTIEMSCDNSADLYLNGALVGSNAGFTIRSTFSKTLIAGPNTFAAVASNNADAPPNPCGFILSVADATSGEVLFRTTDEGGWDGYAAEPVGWPTP